MKFHPTGLPGVLLIEPDVFKDARGFFLETYHERKYAEGGIPGPFVQDNPSYSGRGTLRGLHGVKTGRPRYPSAEVILEIAALRAWASSIRWTSPRASSSRSCWKRMFPKKIALSRARKSVTAVFQISFPENKFTCASPMKKKQMPPKPSLAK